MNQKNYLYLHEERRSRSIELEKKTTYEEDYQSLGGNVRLQLHRMFAWSSFRFSPSFLWRRRGHSEPMATDSWFPRLGQYPAWRHPSPLAWWDLRMGGNTQTADSRCDVAHGDKIQKTHLHFGADANAPRPCRWAETQFRDHQCYPLRFLRNSLHRGHLYLFRFPKRESGEGDALQGVPRGGVGRTPPPYEEIPFSIWVFTIKLNGVTLTGIDNVKASDSHASSSVSYLLSGQRANGNTKHRLVITKDAQGRVVKRMR